MIELRCLIKPSTNSRITFCKKIFLANRLSKIEIIIRLGYPLVWADRTLPVENTKTVCSFYIDYNECGEDMVGVANFPPLEMEIESMRHAEDFAKINGFSIEMSDR